MILDSLIACLGLTALGAVAAIAQPLETQPGSLPGVDVSALPNSNNLTAHVYEENYWTPLTTVLGNPAVDTSTISLDNWRTGNRLAQTMITALLVASEIWLYENQKPVTGFTDPSGVNVEYVAGYTHRFWIDPNAGVRLTYLEMDAVIKYLNGMVFQVSANKELLFDIKRSGRRIGFGGVTDSRKPGISIQGIEAI